jgi:hypothetical protein
MEIGDLMQQVFRIDVLCEDRNHRIHQIFEFHSSNLSKDKTFCVLSTPKKEIHLVREESAITTLHTPTKTSQ